MNIYNPHYQKYLFDQMALSYSAVNLVASFGLSQRWRRQCINQLPVQSGTTLCDFMSGQGECWKILTGKLKQTIHIKAFDFSPKMTNTSLKKTANLKNCIIDIHTCDLEDNKIKNHSVDYVISCFGLKTLSKEKLNRFANEVKRILKPDGMFSFVELSIPDNRAVACLYSTYMRVVIPMISVLFTGNIRNYKMLYVYTNEFKNCEHIRDIFLNLNFDLSYHRYFLGCATGISGRKNNVSR